MPKIYGSLNNRLQGHCEGEKPVVGMGVTELGYTDRSPYEVIEVVNEKKIRVRSMSYERIDGNGMSDCQEYKYSSKPDGVVKTLVFRNGRWRDLVKEERYLGDDKWETVETRKLGPNDWYVGKAERYYDFSF